MDYEIQNKSDILLGASLVVKIPEEDLDRKALYTIQVDRPGFILPFRYRVIDGQIEFVYQIAAQSKLQYLAGERYPKDYADLWSGVLSPLFECGDWFLKPYSFVLDMNYLYCDKNKNIVSYVYIPSKRDCSDYFDLKEMAAEFSRKITVTVADLENKVLRAIMLDFNPRSFLQMLKSYTAVSAPLAPISHMPPQYAYGQNAFMVPENTAPGLEMVAMPEPNVAYRQESAVALTGEIVIGVPPDLKPGKKAKENKRDKKNTNGKENERINGNKPGEYPQGHVADFHREANAGTGCAPTQATGVPPQQYQNPAHGYSSPAGPVDITQNLTYEKSGTWLRLVGSASLPPAINISIVEGQAFTIGRYDTAAGRQQSNFEFDKTTKAVSRRHAAIERRADGYNLIDLSSSAGTFLNGQKIPPNTPCKLESGCRMSFGNCGADYVWEQ